MLFSSYDYPENRQHTPIPCEPKQYNSDYDGKFPSVYDDTNPSVGRLMWADKIFPYAKNREMFACPGGPNQVNMGTTGNLQGTRYNMNMCHWWSWPEGTVPDSDAYYPGYPVKEDAVEYPAELALLFESSNAWWCHWLPHQNVWGTSQNSADGKVLIGVLGETIYPRHNGGCNVAHADGHAKWYSTNNLADLSNPWRPMFVIRKP